MSRSRRKTPIIGITTARSDKPFKVAEHRRERCAVRTALASHADVDLNKAFGNPWNAPKDGHVWVGNDRPHLLRK